MIDQLGQLLDQRKVLYGVLCRDPTMIELELIAQAGYSVVWIDLEHAPFDVAKANQICRTIVHLGMVPAVRIVELTKSQVQCVLDGGYQIVLLPMVADAAQAQQFVKLGKYPPLGRRGLSSCAAGTDYTLGPDPKETVRQANATTRLMVQFEHDEALADLDAILAVDGIDMITVGPFDWGADLGLYGAEAVAAVGPKVEKVLTAATAAGKIAAAPVGSPEQARHYADLGVRVLFVAVDVVLKRKAFTDALTAAREAVEGA